jgi:hypothetical protein
MESPDPKPNDGFGILLKRLIDLSGLATCAWNNLVSVKVKAIAPKLISKAKSPAGKPPSIPCRRALQVWRLFNV